MVEFLFLDLDDTILDFHKAERIAISKTIGEFGVEPTEENLTAWFKAGVFCVGMGSKLFPKDKVEAEDWTYVTEKCREALGYIAALRK